MRNRISDRDEQEDDCYEVGIFEVIHTKRVLRISEMIRRGKILRSRTHEISS